MRDPCVNRDDIERFHAGELDAAGEARVAAHLRACPACAELDRAVRAEHEALLAELRDMPPTAPPGGDEARPRGAPPPNAEPGSPTTSAHLPERIADFRILSLIGQGGMGAVYEAEQAPLGRRVALKVIKSGLASADTLKRFELESRVLARLEHPGIARIYEAGTADAGAGPQPYFAMELIAGVPLTDYAEQRSLGLRRRLELIARIADAVQHAHAKGVIHRDLKPGNILVMQGEGVEGQGAEGSAGQAAPGRARLRLRRAPGSGDAGDAISPSTPRPLEPLPHAAQPKVLDFGIARVTEPGAMASADAPAARRTLAGQIIGTLAYMSPEQAGGDPDDVDTRSDVYSLGVVAYELLSGRLPYELPRSIVDAARVIREQTPAPLAGRRSRDDPRPKPPMGSVGILPARGSSGIATRTTPADVPAAGVADVAPGAAGLMDGGAAVAAGALAGRRAAAGPASATGVTPRELRGDVETIVLKALEKDKERRYATAASLAADIRRYLTDQPIAARPASAMYQLRKFARRNRALVGGVAATAVVLVLGVIGTTAGLIRAEQQRQLAERRADETTLVVDFQAQMLTKIMPADMADSLVDGAEEAVLSAGLRSGLPQGEATQLAGQVRSALEAADMAGVAVSLIEQQLLRPAFTTINQQFLSTPSVRAGLLHRVAAAYGALGLLDESYKAQRLSYEIEKEHFGDAHPETALSKCLLARLLIHRGALEEADRLLADAVALFEAKGEERRRCIALMTLAELRRAQGDAGAAYSAAREAHEGLRRLAGVDDPNTAMAAITFAQLLVEANEAEKAEGLLVPSLATLPPRSETVETALAGMNALAVAARRAGRTADALNWSQSVLDLARKHWGRSDTRTLTALHNHGRGLEAVLRFDDAAACLMEAALGRRKRLGPADPLTMQSQGCAGAALIELGQYDKACQFVFASLEGRRAALGEMHRETGYAWFEWGRLLEKNTGAADAYRAFETALLIGEQQRPEDLRFTAMCLRFVGNSLRRMGEFQEAERALRRAAEKLRSLPDDAARQNDLGKLGMYFAALYDSWRAAEPGEGHDMKAAEWRERLAALQAGTQTTVAASQPAPVGAAQSAPAAAP